jgi:hypothetical protein
MRWALGIALAAGMTWAGSDLSAIRSEPNPEKRAKLAMEHANEELRSAVKAYSGGDVKGALAAVGELGESVDLCKASLRATGKDARKNPKAFKRAEMEIRELLRRLKSVETDFSVDDRAAILDVEQHLQEIHDDLIQQIMSKKK